MMRLSPMAEGVKAAEWNRGWNRISWGLLVFWVALLGVDRVDFLGGEGGFLLTPFLALTPVLLTFEAFRMAGSRERLPFRGAEKGYLLLLLLFLGVVLLSTLLALDLLMSAKRSSLLVFQGVGTLLVAVTVAARPGSEKALVAGAKLGLALALAFGVLEVAAFLSSWSEPLRFGLVAVNLWPHTYYGIVPRISGQVLDANRGGLLMVFYLFILFRWGEPGVRRWGWAVLGTGMVVLSLSRSALLAGGVAVLVSWLENLNPRVSRPAVLAGVLVLASFCGWILVDGGSREAMARGLEPLAQRLSPMESSTREHFHLLNRGMEEATASVKRASIGLGYGNAYLVLQDVFPGNKYGNFHSLYVSLLAESGVFALILALVLLGYPLLMPGPYRALVAGFVFFNLFYQALAEPLFWFALAMAWLTLSRVRRASEPPRLEA